jgi:hypothetical protein
MTLLRRLALPILVTLFIAACTGAQGSRDAAVPTGESGAPAVADKGLVPEPAPGANGGDGSALIVTSSLTLAVDELEAAVAAARATVRANGGTLVGISRGSDGGYPVYREDGSLASIAAGPASLTFRIPAGALESTIDALRAIGEVTGERTDASDVSASLRDLGARLKNLRAAETNYQRLLGRAESIADLLAITAQLDAVRGEIERLAAEQASLEDGVARSTLSLTLYPPATPIADATDRFDLGAIVEQATGTLVGVAIALVTVAVYLLVLGIPLLALVLLAALLVRHGLRARTRVQRTTRR